MDKHTKVEIKAWIGVSNHSNGVVLEGEYNIEQLTRTCRQEVKKGGGCPVGNLLSCPFEWEPYKERHKGERPLSCVDVRNEDWIDLFEMMKEDYDKRSIKL